MSQRQKVLVRVYEVGYVDNFWAIENYILRLGAIIHGLRKDGMHFTGAFGKELGYDREYWHNYYYHYVPPVMPLASSVSSQAEREQPALL